MKFRACSLITLFIISLLLLVFGILLHIYFGHLFDRRIKSEISLRKDSQIYPKWEKTPVALDFKVYILEVVNSRKVIEGSKPVIRERGPFHFTEYRRKEVLGYSPDGRTVKYKEYKEYFFDRSQSNYSLDRKVTFVNIPVVTIATRITDFLNKLPFQTLTRPIVSGAMTALLQFHSQNLFATRTVRELLFDGYRVNVLDTIKLISMPLKLIGISIPYIPLINNTFGIFHNRNNTPEGPFEVFTGVGDYTKIGQFATWKNKISLNHWKGKECNVLNGTDGIQFSPFLKKEQILSVFVFEACRSVLLGFDKETEVKGIKTYRFKPLQSNYRSAKQNSDNWCYCNTRKKSCNYDGVIDISPCWFNAPLYASHPHFYNASKKILEKVKGLQPDEEKHTSYVDIEPTTGSALRGARRFALNVEIKNFPIISSSRNILKPAIIPILWVEESSQLSDELRDEMNSKLFMTKMVAEIGIKVLIAAGVALLSIILVIICFKRGRNNTVRCVSTLNDMKPSNVSRNHFLSSIVSKLRSKNIIPKSLFREKSDSTTQLQISQSGSEISEISTSDRVMEASTFTTRRQSVSILKNNDLLAELKQMRKDKNRIEEETDSDGIKQNVTSRRVSIDEPIEKQRLPPLPRRRSSLAAADVSKLALHNSSNKLLNNSILPSMKEESTNDSKKLSHELQNDKSIFPPVEVVPKVNQVISDRRMSSNL